MVAEPEALERERAQAELTARLEQLRAAEGVDAVAVGELEPQRVELPACDRDPETGAVLRVLEREEDAGPTVRAPQLGHLALDPDRREPLEPGGDPAVEGSDGVDLAVAVLDRLDLHEGQDTARPAG